MILENFSWLIENQVAGMAHPGTEPEAFGEIRATGVGAVVSLTMRPLPERLLREADLAYLHVGVQNFRPPTPSQVQRFVRFVDENLQAGRPVVAHCLAGMGRTGTMLACYLVSRGMAPLEAVRTVRSKRPGSIETEEQEDAIFAYAAEHRDRPGA